MREGRDARSCITSGATLAVACWIMGATPVRFVSRTATLTVAGTATELERGAPRVEMAPNATVATAAIVLNENIFVG